MGGTAAAYVGGGRVGMPAESRRSRVPESSSEAAAEFVAAPAVRVEDVLGPPAPVVPIRLSVAYARKIAELKSATLLVVEEDGRLVGVVERRDLDRADDEGSLTGCMRRLALTVAPTATIERARDLLVKHQLSALPVVAGMFVVGSVSRQVVERALAGRASALPASMRAAA